MKLYFMKGACSMVPHTALEWIGQPYESQQVTLPETKTPEYLALNPQGAVPLLIDGEMKLSQNVAIIFYLDELHPEAHLFGTGDSKARADAMRWLMFLNADLHKAFAPLFHLPAYAEANETIKTPMVEYARESILKMLSQANDQLAGKEYLTGELTIADVYLYVELRWCKGIRLDFSHLTNLVAFFDRIPQNAGVKAVLAKEGLSA